MFERCTVGRTKSSAPGIACAMSSLWLVSVTVSNLPVMTSVGREMRVSKWRISMSRTAANYPATLRFHSQEHRSYFLHGWTILANHACRKPIAKKCCSRLFNVVSQHLSNSFGPLIRRAQVCGGIAQHQTIDPFWGTKCQPLTGYSPERQATEVNLLDVEVV